MESKNRFASDETNDEVNNGGVICGGGKVSIHPSLRAYPVLNYVKIDKGEKRCIEVRWNTRVMMFWDSSLNQHLEDGGMYGVQVNKSLIEIDGILRQLLIIDFDNREFQDKVIDKFPETKTTSSGSKKNCLHLWLATDRLEKKFAIRDEENNTLADVLGEHGQIVAPNSFHPGGSTYKIVNDVPIAYIPYDEVLSILKPYMKEEKPSDTLSVSKPKKDYGTNTFFDMVRSKIDVTDVLNKLGIDTQHSRTNCPFHDSDSGECLSFNKETWNCWNCGKHGNLFTLVKEAYELGNKETFEKLAELTGLEDELREEQVNYMKQEASE